MKPPLPLSNGYSIFHGRPILYNWRAAYGLMLMAACREADKASAALGYFVAHSAPSEEEFRGMWRQLKSWKHGTR